MTAQKGVLNVIELTDDLDADTQRKARLTLARNAKDADELRVLLAMTGLDA